MRYSRFLTLAVLGATLFTRLTHAQTPTTLPTADQSNGTYQNSILHTDYSDPDVIRVGNDYYMTASSFTSLPGLPILHSKDLVNWDLLTYALPHYPIQHLTHHVNGGGVWAPSLRYHEGQFYIYFADPDLGVYMTRTKDPAGEWLPPVQVHAGGGWIDPCPLWDDDGKAWLVHAFAASRANGLKNVLHIAPLSPDGTHTLDEGQLAIDGNALHLTTLEGPKLYKRNGYYYIMAPAGGVTWGYQMAFRSKTLTGPYEARLMMHQGDAPTNGPHQGAWITTQTNEDWFIHFQDRGAFGRITHLQPLQWLNDWPIAGDISENKNPDTAVGIPVTLWKKPNVGPAGRDVKPHNLPTTDEFDSPTLGLQWQWFSDWNPAWYSLTEKPGTLRLKPVLRDENQPIFTRSNLLLQKLPAERFVVTTKLDVSDLPKGAAAGLAVVGNGTVALRVTLSDREMKLEQVVSKPFTKPKNSGHASDDPPIYQPAIASTTQPSLLYGNRSNTGAAQLLIADITKDSTYLPDRTIYLRITVTAEDHAAIPRAMCTTSVSTDGQTFKQLGDTVGIADYGWIGAKIGLFCNAAPPLIDGASSMPTTSYTDTPKIVSTGFVDVDWFRFAPLPATQE